MLGLSDNRLSSYSLLTSAFVIFSEGMQGKFFQSDSVCREKQEPGSEAGAVTWPFLSPMLGPSGTGCVQWRYVGTLNLAPVGEFTPWKSANATYKSRIFFSFLWRVGLPAHYCFLSLIYIWRISANVQKTLTRCLTHCGHNWKWKCESVSCSVVSAFSCPHGL